MYLCNIRPRQTFLPLFLGSFIEALGLTLLTYALHTSSTPLIYTMMGLTGAGTGLRFMPGSLHGIGFFPNKVSLTKNSNTKLIYFLGELRTLCEIR
jgi:hypothetical protein